MENLKVIALEAENVKRLHAVNIQFDGTLQVIGGDNGEGKSSVLDSIWLAIGGGKATRDTQTTRPIHDGERHATATVDLGEIIVTRTWRDGKASTVKVTTPEGAEHKSPQAILDALTANVGIDPLAFTQLNDKEQVKELLGLVKLPFVPADLDADYKRTFEERAAVNKQVKNFEARLAGYPKPAPGLPDAEVSVRDLVDEVQRVEAVHRTAAMAQDAYDRSLSDIERLEAQLTDARAHSERTLEELGEARAAAHGAPPLDTIKEALDNAEDTNAAVRVELDRKRGLAALNAEKAKAAALSAKLEKINETRAHGLAQAVWPIEGLGFDLDGLTFNKVPFKQASSAEQIRVSMAMAMALNPTLKTLFIRDGSLLDGKNMRLVAELAAAQGFQIIMERVGTQDKGAVIIEDGRVAP
jgi:DNA repair exonuclease SbcCD ATPase subunit